MRTYLSVTFAEKEEAKRLGARWDPKKKRWYAPSGEKQLVERWPLSDEPIRELIGEDREFSGNQLFVDLVPRSCWFTNVRKCVHPSDWDRLRRYVYERAGNRCECCNAEGRLDAHERWYFDEESKVQKLLRIIALCEACHEVTHMGLAQIKGREEAATNHLMKVTGMDCKAAESHKNEAFDLWRSRNRFAWDLDLSIITDSGIKLAKSFVKADRKEVAEDETLQIRAVELPPDWLSESKSSENGLNENPVVVKNSQAEKSIFRKIITFLSKLIMSESV